MEIENLIRYRLRNLQLAIEQWNYMLQKELHIVEYEMREGKRSKMLKERGKRVVAGGVRLRSFRPA